MYSRTAYLDAVYDEFRKRFMMPQKNFCETLGDIMAYRNQTIFDINTYDDYRIFVPAGTKNRIITGKSNSGGIYCPDITTVSMIAACIDLTLEEKELVMHAAHPEYKANDILRDLRAPMGVTNEILAEYGLPILSRYKAVKVDDWV